MIDWTKPCDYNEPQKHLFHREARKRLQQLAERLQFPRESYSIRSNKAGVAVSGEITLHGSSLYVQVSQSAMGPGMSILVRTCKGQKDFTGGQNNFAPLAYLDDIEGLAGFCKRVLEREGVRP